MLGRHSFSGGGSRPLALRSLGEGGSRPTRRSFIRAGAGLAAIIAAGKAPAAFIRSMLAARNGLMAGGGWKNPYITDGLVAMWDGEWNAGLGVHDDGLIGARNLVGEGDLVQYNQYPYMQNDGTSFYKTAQKQTLYIDKGLLSSAFTIVTSGLLGLNYDGILHVSQKWVTSYLDWQRVVSISYRRCRVGNNYSSVTWSNMPSDRMVHVAIVGTSTGITIWADGEIAKQGTLSASDYNLLLGSNYLMIGGRLDVSSGSAPNGLSSVGAKYNNIYVYNRNLTAAEIAANYAVDKARFNLPA